ncbi:heterokaryon incompatibility protein-domain-containing protein [Daldinia vernicosa]|uniref:heterokaryon incompatibility protein-domain-containing protein n=1 Tax=Daldinia vernicosa TaxID=114800 RepID=UPI002008CA1A|nr:heterokaryon incompatibility protein-domain-containing protein [Daldinia vernicosa]KAI0848823.1 heterokaryon incompatibility protein-domain-containing protein [Daldinia vernicosa]
MAVGRMSTADLVFSLQNALQKCKELHGSRCEVTPPKNIPNFWIIDTQENCLVPGDSVDKYAALSYVWRSPLDASSNRAPTQRQSQSKIDGRVLAFSKRFKMPRPGHQFSIKTERLMLQRDKLDNFRKPGFLSFESGVAETLPEVIRDSMDFVRQSGVRYLWVDCLCIPQNDEATGDSVLSMRDIYSGAYFTIIAAAESSGLYGSGDNIESVENEDGVPDASSLHGALLMTHWATRGWTFQEQMLSKRSFVFLNETAFWDCQEAVWWSESLITGQEADARELGTPKAGNMSSRWISQGQKDFTGTRNYKANRQLSRDLMAPSTPNFRLYMELICRYNHRNLTYAQDALPAIAGVFDALANRFSGGFISGLPAIFLDSALLWQPLLKAKRRVCSGKRPESFPPLPSWSWAGWQCLIDPISLEGALDYEIRGDISRGGLGKSMCSWRTRKLVDWVCSTTAADECEILEPRILEQYKGLRDNPSDKELPDGWSHKTEYTDSEEGVKPCAPTNRPKDWYFYDSNAQSAFRYPLPITHVPQTVGNQGYKRFLSCTTSTTTFKVRRVLYPHRRAKLRTLRKAYDMRKSCDISALDTQLYTNEPDFKTYCPVITLEDEHGRWAGLLRVMDDNKNIKAQQTVEVIAISQGSSCLMEAAMTYEERVDRLACYRFGGNRSDHCHFALTKSFQKKTVYFQGDSRSECYKSMEKEADGRDQGPFFLKNIDCRELGDYGLPEEWEHKRYDFYNVLWVERRGDFMERKAAGRVPKDIWEQNQGALQSIRLG